MSFETLTLHNMLRMSNRDGGADGGPVYFLIFCKIWRIFYTKSWKLHIIALFLLVISLEPFEVERRTIPHFKAWNKLFRPLFIQKYSEGSQNQIISKRKSPIFFDPDFRTAESGKEMGQKNLGPPGLILCASGLC